MIPEHVIARIKALLAEGEHSQREIARRTKVNRNTVSRISRGKRPDFSALRRARREQLRLRSRTTRRCPGCGARVYRPCLRCRLIERSRATVRKLLPMSSQNGFTPLGVELQGKQRERYEVILARKIKNGESPFITDAERFDERRYNIHVDYHTA